MTVLIEGGLKLMLGMSVFHSDVTHEMQDRVVLQLWSLPLR